MELFNPLDADKWRDLISDFDRKRIAFAENLEALNNVKGKTFALEDERKQLIKEALPIQKKIDDLMNALTPIREFLQGIGRFFGLGETPTLNDLGIAPIVLGIGIAGAAVIVNSITSWLSRVQTFSQKNMLAQTLAEQGATPQEIIKAVGGNGTSAKLFGFDVRWIMAIIAVGAGAYYFTRMRRN